MHHAQGPVLLHVWMVDPQTADSHIQRLAELFQGVSDQPGFVSARILEAPDRDSIAAIIEMRTAEDREQFERLPQVHEVLHRLGAAANLVVRLYDDVAAFA
jgi:hypothetical protein